MEGLKGFQAKHCPSFTLPHLPYHNASFYFPTKVNNMEITWCKRRLIHQILSAAITALQSSYNTGWFSLICLMWLTTPSGTALEWPERLIFLVLTFQLSHKQVGAGKKTHPFVAFDWLFL